MATLTRGIGNSILTGDDVGISIARKLKKENSDLKVTETSAAGIALLDLTEGYDKLVIM